jgi:hypothetical protein
MTKQWIAPAMGLALVLSVSLVRPAAAFRQHGAKTAASAATAPAAAATTVSGIIKGAPAGKMITVVSGKRSTMVDTSHATIRNKGKFASASALTAGTYVRAEGTMAGTSLNAKSIDILRAAGGSKKNPASMNGKMPAQSGTKAKP